MCNKSHVSRQMAQIQVTGNSTRIPFFGPLPAHGTTLRTPPWWEIKPWTCHERLDDSRACKPLLYHDSILPLSEMPKPLIHYNGGIITYFCFIFVKIPKLLTRETNHVCLSQGHGLWPTHSPPLQTSRHTFPLPHVYCCMCLCSTLTLDLDTICGWCFSHSCLCIYIFILSCCFYISFDCFLLIYSYFFYFP